ncbi:MAG TPA: lytic transglycosylase domain-containing protein [Geminicoccaceae bacterium]|nr:lytic transglycosylase domain-containing protein [Geminicoccaceae bacterium]
MRAALRRWCLPAWLLLAATLAVPMPAHALDPKDRGVVGQAFRAAERGEWPRVWRLLGEVADPLPAKTLRWLRMIEDGQPADFAAMAGFLMANPDWPYPEQLQVMAEEAIRDPADHGLIRAFFAERPPLTTRGRIRYAQALLRVGADAEAVALIRKAWIEGDFSAREDKRFFAQYRRHLREQDHIARLDSLLWDMRRSSAQRMLERVPAGYRRLAEARMALQRGSGRVDRAIEAVPAALRDDPGLAYDRLRWRRQHRLYDGVEAILLDPPEDLGRADRWWFERGLEIRRSLRRRDFDRAYRLAASHRQTGGKDFAEAAWFAGWLALRHAERPSEAFRRFVEMYEAVSAPTERARAAYWAGRSAAALGDAALARYWYQAAARYRIAYYGQVAALELGEPVAAAPVPPPTDGERAAFEAGEIARVARMLIEVGAEEQLRPFAMHLIGQAASPTEVGMAADLIAESGRVDLVTQASRAAAWLGQVNEAAAFPIPDLASLLAERDGAPEAALLLGVARQESTFNTWGTSHAGARGLLQLMPRTAHLMARALRVPYNQARLTADPDYNVLLGRHYLGVLLDRYGGEVVLAVCAYNAGPRRVEEWLELNGDPRRGGPHAMVDWIELIPFDETRNYVQRVIEARDIYRQRLAEEEPATVRFRRVAGPIRPMPTPQLKPLGAAHAAHDAGVADAAPLPQPKPVVETSLTPAAEPPPAARPEARRGGPGAHVRAEEPGADAADVAPPGQTIAALARMPRARPALASLDPSEGEAAMLVLWPEPKPDDPLALKEAAEPPQPELKPEVP